MKSLAPNKLKLPKKKNIANTIERLQVDMDKLQAQIELQTHQVAIAKETLTRYEFAYAKVRLHLSKN